MCTIITEEEAKAMMRPEYKLVDLMNSEMQVSGLLNAVALKLFLKAHWDEVAKLAHRIHGVEMSAGEKSALDAQNYNDGSASRSAALKSYYDELDKLERLKRADARKRRRCVELFDSLKEVSRTGFYAAPGAAGTFAEHAKAVNKAEALIAQIEDDGK